MATTRLLFLLACAVWACLAFEIKLDETKYNQQRCSGMYSKSSWGGSGEPVITVKFLNSTGDDKGTDPIASIIIFEWQDEALIGIPDPGNPQQLIELCQEGFDKNGWCTKEQVGQFLLRPNATRKSINKMQTAAIHLDRDGPLRYPIENTGYYCIFTDTFTASKYEAVVEFRNAYGELPASQIPKLLFYSGMTILYAVAAILWGFLYYQHRSDILPVQNYITAILVFLIVEMIMTWGYYEHQNRNGSLGVMSRVLLVVTGVLNAARNSFSFFLLLIVCMGYGVVKHTLGRTMVHVRWLAMAHFVFGLIYAITSLVVSPESAGVFVLLIVLPLAGTLTAFYVWTLNSLNFTLKDLRDRKQHFKEAMYRKLWWSILASIIVIFGFFVFSSFTVSNINDINYVPYHWKSRWFILDGWLNVVYFGDVAWIAYVWRPTANNRRFAMSDELAQDDDGTFEIGDIGNPDDSDDDEEARISKANTMGSKIASSSSNNSLSASRPAYASSSRGTPATKNQPRHSLDGETIFAVGEERFSDDEDEQERSDAGSDMHEDNNLVKGR
jgi:uncharacterized membrane protein YjfL (UPF0719 family)